MVLYLSTKLHIFQHPQKGQLNMVPLVLKQRVRLSKACEEKSPVAEFMLLLWRGFISGTCFSS
jgi:hypothetical protein